MKIYFEDGPLLPDLGLFTPDFTIDASCGVTQTLLALNWVAKTQPDSSVCTNSILALDNKFAWNNELQVPEVYIRAGEYMVFTRIDRLTTRQLTESHNLAKLYLAGEFG